MSDKHLKLFIFILHLLALLLYRVFGYSGHFGFDDMEYAEVAYQLSQGNIDFGNHFVYRFAIIIPTAISYLLFGVNDFASSLPSIFASTLILLFVYKWVKSNSPAVVSLSLSMTLFSEWFLFYSNKLMVDVHVCLAFVIIIHILYSYRNNVEKSPIKYALLLALGLLYGFLAKGTIILIVPLLLFFFIHDYEYKKNIKFWEKSFFFTLLLFASYFVIIFLLSGSATSRFDAIEANSYTNHCSYSIQPTTAVLNRIFVDFLTMIRNEGFAFSFLFVFVALIFYKKFKFFDLDNSQGFFLSSSLILFLSANFMSISLTSYNPMCIDFRHYLWLVPITSVSAAHLIFNKDSHRTFQYTILALLLLITFSSYLNENKLFLRLYLPMSALYFSYIIIRKNLFQKSIFPILFSLIFLIQPIHISLTARENNYTSQKKFIIDQIANNEGKVAIMTDKVQARMGNYWLAFDQSKALFFPFDSIHLAEEEFSNIQLLINPYTQFFARTNAENYPSYVKQSLATNALTFNEELNIRFWNSAPFLKSQLKDKLLFSSKIDFEENNSDWNIHTNQRTNLYAHGGTYSYKVEEYSGALKKELSQFNLTDGENLFIEIVGHVKLNAASDPLIVISIDNENGNSFWKGEKIVNDSNTTNWKKASAVVSISNDLIKENSQLSIYIWDTAKGGLFIDDFEVNVYSN